LRGEGKRELLANGLRWSGALLALAQLPPEDGLLVLCYHRIGDYENDPYDAGLISASGDQFDQQVKFLKRKGWLVTLDEALAFAEGKTKREAPRVRVLITFDDGCLDNYETAFPILRSHEAQGVFFLCTGLVGSSAVLWWDEIAYLLKHSSVRRFTLNYPFRLHIDIDKDGMNRSVVRVNHHFRKPDNLDRERFIQELKAALGESVPRSTARRYLNLDEAREMIAGGMAIGGHTHSHALLSKLTPEEQRKELTDSRTVLSEQLGIEVNTLAYPYGFSGAFTEQTEQIARDAGYRAAFSFYGGFNSRRDSNRYNLKRVGVAGQSPNRFRAQVSVSRLNGRFWP
jgi:peptidoglycan/xylan/chitin deacetylase (PgdA/CDA1 family)